MRTLLAVLVMAALFCFGAKAQTSEWSPSCAYSKREFQDVSLAMWNEGGSTMLKESAAEEYERRLMAYTLVVRSKKSEVSWYNRRDWRGPNLSNVVAAPRQYSYRMKGYRNEEPVSHSTLWEKIQEPVKAVQTVIQNVIVDPLKRHVTSRHLWDLTKLSVLAVVCDGWKPPDPRYLEADTYESWCSVPQLYKPTCNSRLVSSERSQCWFELEEVLLDQSAPEGFRHVYWRRMSWQEMKGHINDVPAHCRGRENYVANIHSAQMKWIEWEEAKLKNPSLKEPEMAEREPQGHHARPHRSSKKHRKS